MDTLELIKQYRRGEEWAKDKVILDNVGLVWSIVRRFANRGYEMEDLFQIGIIGLIKAVEKFDYSFEVQFSTYAVPMITGEIKRFLRDDGLIKISRSLKENANKIRILKEKYNNTYGIEPTISDIETELSISKEEIVMALESSNEVESIYKTVYQGDGSPIYLLDKLTSNVKENDNLIDAISLNEVIDNLESKEKEVIIERYYNNKTQTDIAKKLGISQVQVSRIEKKVLLKMREMLAC